METHPSNNETRNGIISKLATVLREERATTTSIESAVYKAGLDRESVNATFGSMHDLILEMISDLSGALTQPLQHHHEHQTLRDVLTEFGLRVVDTYSDSHLIALYRIALTEATRHSGIGRECFERGPGKLATCLAQYLEYSSERFSHLRINNPKRLADIFLGLLGENLELFDTSTSERTSRVKDRCDAVNEAVELFCCGIVAEEQ